MSESLARQNPQSPFRRAPSMVRQQSRSIRTESVSSGAFEQQTDDLLQLARTNIQKLKVKEEKKVSQTVCVRVRTYMSVCVRVQVYVCAVFICDLSLRLYMIRSLTPQVEDMIKDFRNITRSKCIHIHITVFVQKMYIFLV